MAYILLPSPPKYRHCMGLGCLCHAAAASAALYVASQLGAALRLLYWPGLRTEFYGTKLQRLDIPPLKGPKHIRHTHSVKIC